MANDVPPVPYQTPVVDRTGTLTVPWTAWFRQLLQRIGGNSGEVLLNPMTTLGDLIYGGSSGTPLRLSGDTSNTRKFLRELSSGSTATAPVWDALLAADIPSLSYISSTSTQLANKVLSGPSSGSAAAPTFRLLGNADFPLTVSTQTATYQATVSDGLILCNTNAFTVTLPAASAMSGQVLRIQKIGADVNVITISRGGSDTINGGTSKTLTTQYEVVTLVSDGVSAWYVLSRGTG